MDSFGLLNQPPNTYFVTLTYSDKQKFFNSWLKDLPEILKWLQTAGTFRLVAEISNSGVFHWHYILGIKDNIKHCKFLNHWRYHKGHIDIKPIKNLLGSFIYIRKQSYDISQELCNKLGVDHNSALAIITNSTAPLVLQVIKRYYEQQKANNRNTKKINELNIGIFKFYKQHNAPVVA